VVSISNKILCSNYSACRSLGLPSFQFWSSSQSLEQKQFCSSLTFLTLEQRLYCQTNPKVFTIINRSIRLAIDECQYQFRNQRWNCSLFNQPDLFGKFILRSKNI
jgi:hypothetical protein